MTNTDDPWSAADDPQPAENGPADEQDVTPLPEEPTAESERFLREYRARRAAERGEDDGRDDPRKVTLSGMLPSNPDHPLNRILAMRAANPERAAEIDQALAAHDDAQEEIRKLRRGHRYAHYIENRPAAYTTAQYLDFDRSSASHAGAIIGWWKSGAKTLLLAGPPGRGKTHAGYAICNEVAAADRDGISAATAVRAYTIGEIRELLRPADQHVMRDDVASSRRAREIAGLRTVDLLLIDDLTSADVTPWFREELHKIIDTRVNNGRRTIVTLNVSDKRAIGKELNAAVGSPIVSRLRDQSVSVWVDGPDRRKPSEWDWFEGPSA